jgi:hypothetical protein
LLQQIESVTEKIALLCHKKNSSEMLPVVCAKKY